MSQRKALLLLGLLVVGLLAFAVANDRLFGGLRLDLSREKLFTLSPDTRAVLSSLEKDLELRFFFSYGVSREISGLRNYARRVENFLEEYAERAGGRLDFTVVDPEPFSEAEDEAAGAGLQAVPVPGAGTLYFGLIGRSSDGEERILPFFTPERERFLEYEITRLIYQLEHPEPVRVGLMTGLQMAGSFSPASPTGNQDPWMIWRRMQNSYDVRTVSFDVDRIPAEIELLMLVHPVDLSQATLYALDQFVLRGGKMLIFLDPFAEQGSPENRASSLEPLLSAWGVRMPADKVLLDASQALNVQAGNQVVRHLALMGVKDFVREDPVTGELEMVVFASPGVLEPVEGATTSFTSLLHSSPQSMLTESERIAALYNPLMLQENFQPDNTRHALAARVRGRVSSAFPEGPPPPPEEDPEEQDFAADEDADTEEEAPEPLPSHIAEAPAVELAIVADSDILGDRQWVQVHNFFGRMIERPWADNADLVMNFLETLGSGPHLVGIRSRGRYAQPFTRVEELSRRAESRLRAKEQELSRKLEATEKRLRELMESDQTAEAGGVVQANPEQAAELLRFQEEKLRIRRELRQVRHDLNKDIKALGTRLKLLNILLFPALLTVISLILGWRRRRNWHRRLAIATGRGGA